jgi:phosphoribosylglycinamide formyltransferase-1
MSPPDSPLSIAVLASGRGSNLQALIDAIAAGNLHARIAGVFSDRADAFALQRARDSGLHAEALRPRDFGTRLAFDAALFERIDAVQPDLIVCAGYMRLLGQPVVEAKRGRMLNIHPSLLPAFKGLRTHEQALAAGAPVHGASVHFVTPELDGGPVIAQARVPVHADDDAAALAARVIAREHPLLVESMRLFAAGRVALRDERVLLDGAALASPLVLGDDDRLAA